MRRTTLIPAILLAACAAWCQNRPSADLLRGLQFDGSNSAEVQPQVMETSRSFPDAPSSVQRPTETRRLVSDEARPPLLLGAVGISAGVTQETELEHSAHGPQPSLTTRYQGVFLQKESSPFLAKHQYPSLLEQERSYHPSTSDGFMGRASYAASRIFVTHDSSGKGRLNTRYFLGVLASVALHSANRSNRTQSTSATFNDFGSTVGGDAGMNVFHEFGPGIQQIMKAHTPKFVSRLEERFNRN
jgi:hypothetical protein